MTKFINAGHLKVYYSNTAELTGDEEYNDIFLLLPQLLQDRILKYAGKNERKLRVLGKLLLLEILTDFGFETFRNLEQLTYTNKNKPVIHENIDFSIAHSSQITICAACTPGKIGIDIEKIKPAETGAYSDFFTPEEKIYLAKKPSTELYRLWTRKEAFAKATGEGIFIPFERINTLEDTIEFGNQIYYAKELAIDPGYFCFLYSTINF